MQFCFRILVKTNTEQKILTFWK